MRLITFRASRREEYKKSQPLSFPFMKTRLACTVTDLHRHKAVTLPATVLVNRFAAASCEASKTGRPFAAIYTNVQDTRQLYLPEQEKIYRNVIQGRNGRSGLSRFSGFPLKTCGNDRKGKREGRARQFLSVMPDGCYRASSVFSLFPLKMDSR